MSAPGAGPLRLSWLGTVDYSTALEAQRAYRDRVIAGEAPEALWLLEHPRVLTLGRRGGGLRVTRSAALDAGFRVLETERGGLATCHEPGQLVGYLFSDARDLGVARLVGAVEAGLAGWLGAVGVPGEARVGAPGVWVGREKVAAIGLHVRHGRTMHGFALNLVNDLEGFGLIVPCGLTDGGVTSVERLTGRAFPPAEVALAVGHSVVRALLDARDGLH